MSFTSLFKGKNLPSSVWNSSILYLPPPLAKAHKDLLIKNEWLADYQPERRGGVGGQAFEEAQEHVINRFLNSAARMQFVCADPNDDQPEVRETVFDQLGDGHIFLLDLAAGNGAGTLAMLSLLCELRLQNIIPKLPLNISILGVDFSADALGYYCEMIDKIQPWLATAGFDLSLKTEVCDLAVSSNFNEVLESFFDEAKQLNVNRFLCVISAISGAGKENVEQMRDSFAIAAARLSSSKRNSSLLWVEPNTNKAWPMQFAESIRLIWEKARFNFYRKAEGYEIKTKESLTLDFLPRKFNWHDPHLSKTTKSHVIVKAFRKE